VAGLAAEIEVTLDERHAAQALAKAAGGSRRATANEAHMFACHGS
jgi:hypothetical protein